MGAVERAVLAPAVTVQILLDAASAAVEGIPGEADDMDQVHDRDGVGEFSVVAVVKPVDPSVATTSSPCCQASGRWDSQVLNACLGRPGTMSDSREGPVRSRMRVRPNMTVTP